MNPKTAEAFSNESESFGIPEFAYSSCLDSDVMKLRKSNSTPNSFCHSENFCFLSTSDLEERKTLLWCPRSNYRTKHYLITDRFRRTWTGISGHHAYVTSR